MGWASYREDIVSRFGAAKVSKVRGAKVEGRPKKGGKVSPKGGEQPIAAKLKEFTATTARPLPVIVLADTSGSMSTDGKIEALNGALTDMVSAFAAEDRGRAEIHIAVITFGGTAQLRLDLTAASKVTIGPVAASGMTPMGAAFELARELVEDAARIPSRAYAPAIILVSDGQPNDEWEPALAQLLSSDRAKKAQRFALGIGADADASVLKRFLASPDAKVYGAGDAGQIKSFFRWVTMSVTSRSRSTTPNLPPADDLPPADLNELL